VADELFFSGTAAEITPIRSVDRITVGAGGRGPVTERIQKVFFEITNGERQAPGNWLTYVNEQKQVSSSDNNGFTGANLTRDDSDTAPMLTFQTAARD
jgi:hypothetical protein